MTQEEYYAAMRPYTKLTQDISVPKEWYEGVVIATVGMNSVYPEMVIEQIKEKFNQPRFYVRNAPWGVALAMERMISDVGRALYDGRDTIDN